MHVLTATRHSPQVHVVWIREALRPESAVSSGLLDASGTVQGGRKDLAPGHQVYVSREDSDCFKLQGDIVDLKPGGWFVIQFSDPTARAAKGLRNFREADLEADLESLVDFDEMDEAEEPSAAAARQAALQSADYHVRFDDL